MVIDDNVNPNNLYNDDTPKQYEPFNCAKGHKIEYVTLQNSSSYMKTKQWLYAIDLTYVGRPNIFWTNKLNGLLQLYIFQNDHQI